MIIIAQNKDGCNRKGGLCIYPPDSSDDRLRLVRAAAADHADATVEGAAHFDADGIISLLRLLNSANY